MDLSLAVASSCADITVRFSPKATSLAVRGELDSAAFPRLDSIARSIAERGRPVFVDASGLTFVDCAGLGVLMRLTRPAREEELSVRLAATSPCLTRLLVLTGCAEWFSLCPPSMRPRAVLASVPDRPGDGITRTRPAPSPRRPTTFRSE